MQEKTPVSTQALDEFRESVQRFHTENEEVDARFRDMNKSKDGRPPLMWNEAYDIAHRIYVDKIHKRLMCAALKFANEIDG